MNRSTVSTGVVDGIPVIVPNVTIDEKDFYISYNNYDTAIYGSDTTALVYGQMQHFYILDGDHREGYKPLMANGFNACLDYFKENMHLINKFSEKP